MIAVRDVDLLRTLILKKGYNYAMFSRTINISRSSLNKIFQSAKVSPGIAHKIASGLNLSFDDPFEIRKP